MSDGLLVRVAELVVVSNAWELALATARGGHTCFISLHGLEPQLVALESDPQELYRAQAPGGSWYLVGAKEWQTNHGVYVRAGLTLFSLPLVGDEWQHLPTQEEHEKSALARVVARTPEVQ